MFRVIYKAEIDSQFPIELLDTAQEIGQQYGRASVGKGTTGWNLHGDIHSEDLWSLGRRYAELEQELLAYFITSEVEVVEEDGAVIHEGESAPIFAV